MKTERATPPPDSRQRLPRRAKLAIVVRERLLGEHAVRSLAAGRSAADRDRADGANISVSRAPIREAIQALPPARDASTSPPARSRRTRTADRVRGGPRDPVGEHRPGAAHRGGLRVPRRDERDRRSMPRQTPRTNEIEVLRAILKDNAGAVSTGRSQGGPADERSVPRRDRRRLRQRRVPDGREGAERAPRRASGGPAECRARPSVGLASTQEIFAALAHRDGPAARRAAERHIRDARARYEAASGNSRRGSDPPDSSSVTHVGGSGHRIVTTASRDSARSGSHRAATATRFAQRSANHGPIRGDHYAGW